MTGTNDIKMYQVVENTRVWLGRVKKNGSVPPTTLDLHARKFATCVKMEALFFSDCLYNKVSKNV